MSYEIPRRSEEPLLRQLALSRWENEGGATSDRTRSVLNLGEVTAATPVLTNAELVQLRIRMIALEALVTVLLTEATDRQLERVREMAVFISPRPDATQHSLTIRAAAQMVHLVERAVHSRASSSTTLP
ncbi:MAG: hypothetical protein ABI859_10055 [Pseudomonadota bacterium]